MWSVVRLWPANSDRQLPAAKRANLLPCTS